MFLTKNFKCSRNIFQKLQFSTKNISLPEESAKVITEPLGQPTPWTHPHICKTGEIAQGVTPSEFKDRRLRLLSSIKKFAIESQSNLKNHLVVIPSASKKYMSDKIPYVFRQNSDFYYLTGCLEPDSVLVLQIDERDSMKSILLVRPKDKHSELWDGRRTGIENAVDYFGVDEAYDVNHLTTFLQNKGREFPMKNPLLVWYDENSSDQPNLSMPLSALNNFPGPLQSPSNFVHRLRLFKSPAEIDLMRKTCQIASESINETISETKVGDSEHHIFARVDYKCRMKNANYLAYPPVVASGNNATTIHYISNTQLTKSGDLVLMDAGCEYAGYTSDITRTWPVNGKFTEPQKVLYEVILLLQKELIKLLQKPGGQSLDELFDTMCIILGKYLQEVGLIAKDLNGVALAKEAYKFCPHHVSHYLGMDVHDTPLMSRSIKLSPGMVCTVEPGIYIAEDRTDVPKEFRGIGIRIEDDVLIKTNGEVEVLTEKCIKERTEIEMLI